MSQEGATVLVGLWHPLASGTGGNMPNLADPNNWVTSLGVVGILIFMVIGFIRNWIITPGRFQDSKDSETHWKTAYENERQAREKSDRIAEQTLDQVELTVKLLNELKEAQARRELTSYREGRPV